MEIIVDTCNLIVGTPDYQWYLEYNRNWLV